jgi:hypothetical protein
VMTFYETFMSVRSRRQKTVFYMVMNNISHPSLHMT